MLCASPQMAWIQLKKRREKWTVPQWKNTYSLNQIQMQLNCSKIYMLTKEFNPLMFNMEVPLISSQTWTTYTEMNNFHYVKKVCTVKRKLRQHMGYRDGAVVRALTSLQCGPGSIPRSGIICGLSLLVLYSAPRGFLWVLRFPLSSKASIWLDLC